MFYFETSKTGIPVIKIDDKEFISWGDEKNGVYRHLFIKYKFSNMIKVWGGEKRAVTESASDMIDLDFNKFPEEAYESFPKSVIEILKNIIKNYLNEDGNFPKNKIEDCANEIVSFDWDDFLNKEKEKKEKQNERRIRKAKKKVEKIINGETEEETSKVKKGRGRPRKAA